MTQLLGTALGAVIALLGVIANGRSSQRLAREERANQLTRLAAESDAAYLAAKRLVLTDLQRSADRLESTVLKEAERAHWLQLPRGGWLAHRTLLANRLDDDAWWPLAEAYNSIADWNDLVSGYGPERQSHLRERHAIVWAMVLRAVQPLASDVAEELLTVQRSLTVPPTS